MTTRLATTIAALIAVACAGGLCAHHSVSMIEVSKSVWLKGTVVRYEPISPHTRFELDVKATDGAVQRWTIEGPFPGRLSRILTLNGMAVDEDFLHAGDVVEVCGFFPKRQDEASADAASLHYVHGHVLIMPDGRMQSWGPYGKLDNCVRAADQPQRWLDFLAADPLAAEHWCQIKRFVGVVSTAPPGFVDEIDRQRISQPCGQRR
jgi:hypothetical protein